MENPGTANSAQLANLAGLVMEDEDFASFLAILARSGYKFGPDASPFDKLADAGFDSLEVTMMVVALEEAGSPLPEHLLGFETLGDIHR